MAEKNNLALSSIHYHEYLALEQLLSAQEPISARTGNEAHEEMLFIIVHQVYELWFKQILHELSSITRMFNEERIDERSLGVVINRLERILSIQQLLIDQIRVMESMTPLDFLDFRQYLFPASGFQSFQFRMVETTLGLPESRRLTYNNKPYHSVFTAEQRQMLEAVEARGTIYSALEKWLERTPFLNFGAFHFLDAYKNAVQRMMEKDKAAIRNASQLTDEAKAMRLQILQANEDYIFAMTDPVQHQQLQREGKTRLSYQATIAALLINLYRDEPILHQPYLLLTRLTEVDEQLTSWRTRHAQMVMRMLGKKMGTGGSSGHDYLAATAAHHAIFHDIANISTLLIPRSELPTLPDTVRKNLNFYYSEFHTA